MTDKKPSNRLPQMPKLTKLPSLHAAKPVAASTSEVPKLSKNPIIPALQSSAVQLPNVADAQPEEGEATVAIQAPSDEDIEKAVTAMKNGGKASLPRLGVSLTSSQSHPKISIGLNDETEAIKPPPEKEIDKAVSEIKKAPKPSLPGFSLPSAPNKVAPPGKLPSLGLKSAPSLDTNSPNADYEQVLSSPAPETPEPPKPEAKEEEAPVFGGAALEESNLQYEDEFPDDENEKTMMLDAAPDDDLDDIGNEKTQISFGAMEFEPLSGKLIVESGKTNQREYLLVREKNTLGRAPSNDIAIADIAMSRKHVEIDKFPEGFRIRDLDSGNGTILNDRRIRVAQLRDGDIIEIGSIRFRFEQSGGDPDVLWKGEPKIELHPNQNNKRPRHQGQPQQPPAPYQNSPQAPQNPPAYRPSPSPQMESMLERQGGGIAAPSWSSPALTNPYIGYSGNVLRTVNTIPTLSIILLVAAVVMFVGMLIFLIGSSISYKSNEKQFEAQKTLMADINGNLVKGIDAYNKKLFDDAVSYMDKAKELDSDSHFVKESLFGKYNDLILSEKELAKDIKQIGDKLNGLRNSGNYTSEEYSKDLKTLENVAENSVNKSDAEQTISKINDVYAKILEDKISNLIKEGKYTEARSLNKELATFPNSSNKPNDFANRIASSERSNSK